MPARLQIQNHPLIPLFDWGSDKKYAILTFVITKILKQTLFHETSLALRGLFWYIATKMAGNDGKDIEDFIAKIDEVCKDLFT